MTGLQMAVFHLSTGHVVGVMTAGRRVPTVAQATRNEHIAVRIPGGRVVRVQAELLTGLATPVDDDVLTRPTHYRVTDATPPLSWTGPPVALVDLPSKPGREALSVWDGGAQPEIARQTLDQDGKLPQGAPPGATHRIVAVAGEPLMYET